MRSPVSEEQGRETEAEKQKRRQHKGTGYQPLCPPLASVHVQEHTHTPVHTPHTHSRILSYTMPQQQLLTVGGLSVCHSI